MEPLPYDVFGKRRNVYIKATGIVRKIEARVIIT